MSKVSYQCEGGVSQIVFDDGKANLMSVDMIGELEAALDRAQADGGVVLLAGRENMFSAGFDLKVFQQGGEPLRRMLESGARLAERLQSFPVPVVAACTGHAIAMGTFLLLSCDYRVGPAADIRICANEVEIGLTVPHFAIETCRLRLVPSAFARAVNTSEPFSGAGAVSAGFLDRVVDQTALLTVARDKARQLSRLNLQSYRETKARAQADHFKALRRAIIEDKAGWSRVEPR